MPSALFDRLKNNASGQTVLDLRRVLYAHLSPDFAKLLRTASALAESQNTSLYIVGGFVRDLILGRPKLDLDLVVEGDAIKFGRQLVKKTGGHLKTHKAFGTAIWTPDRGNLNYVDLISARRETYSHPGALPQVEFADIHADQLRRDFSINTLALRLDGRQAGLLLDPFGGAQDLGKRIIRVLHSKSFSDDPTRILRAFRLAGRLKFNIEPATLKQLKSNIHLLADISGERVRKELELIFEEPKHVEILQTAEKLKVLKGIHSELRFGKKTAQAMAGALKQKISAAWDFDLSADQTGFLIWLMHLPVRSVSGIVERLRFEASLKAAALGAAELHAQANRLVTLSHSSLVATLEKYPIESVYALFLNRRRNRLGKLLLLYARKLRHIRPYANGNTLKRIGVPQGPKYRQILNRLRAAWLDGELKNKRQELAFLRKLVDEAT